MDRPSSSVIFTATLLWVLVTCSAAEPEPRTDPDGVIRVLHVGKAWFLPDHPAPVISRDPRIDYYPVQSHAWSMGEEAFRQLRLYLPRTEQVLHENFDVIVEDGMDASHLPDLFHRWMVTGIDGGMGFLMADDSSSFATSGSHTSWYLFPIGDVLPVDDIQEIYYRNHNFRIVPVEEHRDHPLVRNIPWNEVWVWAHNRPEAKDGATVLAKMNQDSPYKTMNKDKPVMVYWDWGDGRSMAYVHKWHATPQFYRWKWHVDVLSHLIYFPARVEIPADLELVHRLRLLFSDFYYERIYLISTMEFAEKFGANIVHIEEDLSQLMEKKELGDQQYIRVELLESLETYVELMANLDALSLKTIEAKDNALFWIFMGEWLVVSATSMITGFALWTLMIRRRLYREVKVTKLAERRSEKTGEFHWK